MYVTEHVATRQHLFYIRYVANDSTFQMRVSDAWMKRVDDWRRDQPDLPSRAEAIRRLVDLGLEKQKKSVR